MKSLFLVTLLILGVCHSFRALTYQGPIPEKGKHKLVCDQIISIEFDDLNTDNTSKYNLTLEVVGGSGSYSIGVLDNNPASNLKTQAAQFPCTLSGGFYRFNIEKLGSGQISSPIFSFVRTGTMCYKQPGCDDATGECEKTHRQISYSCCPINGTCTINDGLCSAEGLNIPNKNLKDIKIKTSCGVTLYGLAKDFNQRTQVNSSSTQVMNVTSDVTFDAEGVTSGIYPLLTSSANDISLKEPKVINDSILYNLTFLESKTLEYDKVIFYLEAEHLISDNKTMMIVLIVCGCLVGLIILGCLYYQCCYKKGKCKKGSGVDYEKEKEMKV